MPRLFISHSGRDKLAAIAFKQWLHANGWSKDDDVFLDLDQIGGGERWKEALRTANKRCEAVILLASPDSLASPECLAEMRKAEDDNKKIIVLLLRDLKLGDPRLNSFKDRQVVDLSESPRSHVESVTDGDDKFDIAFNAKALARVKDYLERCGIAPTYFAWPPEEKPNAEPFPGLAAFGEDEAGIFFGRDLDIAGGLSKLREMREKGGPRHLVIQAPSGAGKSSYLRAGLWPRLRRDSDFAPLAILRPAKGILTGPDGTARKLAEGLARLGLNVSPGEIRALLADRDEAPVTGLIKLLTQALAKAHEIRCVGAADASPPTLLLAVDQAEELFNTEDEVESDRFRSLLNQLMRDAPAGVVPLVLWTIRAESTERLAQTLADDDLDVPDMLHLRRLPRTSYRDVIRGPLEIVEKLGRPIRIAEALVDKLVDEADGADALPLLAFTLSHLYKEHGSTGEITLGQYLGSEEGKSEASGRGVARTILTMALKRVLAEPWRPPAIPASKKEQNAMLRAAFIPWLARIDPDTDMWLRRPARLDEIPQSSLGMISRLIEARLLVSDGKFVEIAHESLLRQWPELSSWLAAAAEDLKLVEGVERATAEWLSRNRHRAWLVHQAERLSACKALLERPEFRQRLGAIGAAYLKECSKEDGRRTRVLVVALVALLTAAVFFALRQWGVLAKISALF